VAKYHEQEAVQITKSIALPEKNFNGTTTEKAPYIESHGTGASG